MFIKITIGLLAWNKQCTAALNMVSSWASWAHEDSISNAKLLFWEADFLLRDMGLIMGLLVLHLASFFRCQTHWQSLSLLLHSSPDIFFYRETKTGSFLTLRPGFNLILKQKIFFFQLGAVEQTHIPTLGGWGRGVRSLMPALGHAELIASLRVVVEDWFP